MAGAKHLHKAALRFQHVLVDRKTAAGGQRGVDGAERRVRAPVIARLAVCPDGEAAHRHRRDADRVRHLLVRQFEKPGGNNDCAKGDGLGGVDATPATAERRAHPVLGLEAGHDRAKQVLARGARALGDDEAGWDKFGAWVSPAVDVGVIPGGGIGEHGVDARRLVHRQLRPLEPDRRFRLAAVLLREIADDAGRGIG